MSTPNENTKDSADKSFAFPVGAAGKRELKRELRRAKDPEQTILSFQRSHSLHFMISKAFGTMSIPEARSEKYTRSKNDKKIPVESLDTDSVMTFLSHLGVRQYEVHKRISDTFLKLLEDEIRNTKTELPLLNLLSEAWSFAVSLPELRPIIWSVLRQLGEKTPHAVLQALAERDEDGSLKHAEIFRPLPDLLKKLVWEGDWTTRFPTEPDVEPRTFFADCEKTLLYETVYPLVEQYCTNKMLTESANRPFVSSNRERRMVTTQRRALTSSAMEKNPAAPSFLGGKTGSASTGKSAAPKDDSTSSSKAIAQLREHLSDSDDSPGASTTACPYRPKLLYAFMSMLIAKHGMQEKVFLGGADHLHCTLVSDILLSSGGPLPKAYQHVHNLARIIDECVQEGNVTDAAIKSIQAALKETFLPDQDSALEVPKEEELSSNKDEGASLKDETVMTNALQRQLNHIITAGISALKESDPQSLFLNPVTDSIAPGYSKIIKQPMCILDMEQKIEKNEYKNVDEWKEHVNLMFKNCHDYNKGKAGQWFRGEALRQKKVFEEEIFPQARRMYQTEIVKRKKEEEDRKRKAMAGGPELSPLPRATKKRKKEKEEFLPSMPALAFMLLSDPFFIRIVLARVLLETRARVTSGTTLPIASSAIPSLLQLLHMARWSTQISSIRAKRYFIPSGGLKQETLEGSIGDPAVFVPYATLRQDLPLLLRLMLESELDKRIVLGGDLHEAAQSDASLAPPSIQSDEWVSGKHMEVPVALLQSALVHICLPDDKTDLSLAITFPKFAIALAQVSSSFKDDRLFFQCLVRAIIRHKAKLSKDARDAIVKSWLSWLTVKRKKKDNGSMSSGAHECLIMLLNEWSIIGNQILPRDMLLEFVTETTKTVDSSENSEQRKFAAMWKTADPSNPFNLVKKQYLRMLKNLPAAVASQWKEDTGISASGNNAKEDLTKEGTDLNEE